MSTDIQKRVNELRKSLKVLDQKMKHESEVESEEDVFDMPKYMDHLLKENKRDTDTYQVRLASMNKGDRMNDHDDDDEEELFFKTNPNTRYRKSESAVQTDQTDKTVQTGKDDKPVTKEELKRMLREVEDSTFRRVKQLESRISAEAEDFAFGMVMVVSVTIAIIGFLFFKELKTLLKRNNNTYMSHNYAVERFDRIDQTLQSLKAEHLARASLSQEEDVDVQSVASQSLNPQPSEQVEIVQEEPEIIGNN